MNSEMAYCITSSKANVWSKCYDCGGFESVGFKGTKAKGR